jgi:hypothetical protein
MLSDCCLRIRCRGNVSQWAGRGPHRKHFLQYIFYCCVRVSRALPRNGSTCHNTTLNCLWLYSPLLDPGSFFSVLILYTVGRTPWTGICQSQGRYRTAQTQNKRTQASMTQVWFEPTIPVFERAKTVHALDRGHCDRPQYKYRKKINSISLRLVLHREDIVVTVHRRRN